MLNEINDMKKKIAETKNLRSYNFEASKKIKKKEALAKKCFNYMKINSKRNSLM